MADNANIVINDGVPAAHTFTPVKIMDGSVATYQNKTASIVSGRETLKLSMKTGAVIRATELNLKVPRIVTEVLNGVNVSRVADYATCKATVLVPVDWTVAQCKDARALLGNACLNAIVASASDEAEFVY